MCRIAQSSQSRTEADESMDNFSAVFGKKNFASVNTLLKMTNFIGARKHCKLKQKKSVNNFLPTYIFIKTFFPDSFSN